MSKMRYIVFYDSDGEPVRYEAGDLPKDLSGPHIVDYQNESELMAAIDGKLEYKGLTVISEERVANEFLQGLMEGYIDEINEYL